MFILFAWIGFGKFLPTGAAFRNCYTTAWGGGRQIDLDRWIDAEIKMVKEGSNPYYLSGFHCYSSPQAIVKWTARAHKFDGRVCVLVGAKRTRLKPTRGGAILAEAIIVESAEWDKRIELSRVEEVFQMDMKQIIKQQMKHRNIRASQLSQMVGCSAQTLYNYFAGRNEIKSGTIEKICVALGLWLKPEP